MTTEAKNETLAKAAEKEVKLVNLQFTDIFGMLKSVIIPIGEFESALNDGVWFDGSSVDGFARIQESDMYLVPDPNTFALLPWVSKGHPTARIVCDVYSADGKPFEGCPRHILKRALAKARDMGYDYYVGPEIEFYLFRKGEDGEITRDLTDYGGYFDHGPRDRALSVRREMAFALQDLGMRIETSHHEVGPGQHEINIRYGNALEIADHSQTFQYALKTIADNNGLYASFLPKPVHGIAGNGMHTNQSLWKDGKNAFFSADDDYNLSETAYGFIGGQMAHITEICALTNPTVNSYKRLGCFEAPVFISWAHRNRSALIRIPRYKKGKESSTRIELRNPDPSANPYLAFAVMLAAGLDGIKNKTSPPEPVEENLYQLDDTRLEEKGIGRLPSTLMSAINEAEHSSLVRETLGDHAFRMWTSAKKKEWDEYNSQVTRWELERYYHHF